MSRTHDEMVAYALEAEVDLLPHLPELLSDLKELGSDAGLLAEVFGALPLPDHARVIDLGCGKGATASEIADSLGLKVMGVDLLKLLSGTVSKWLGTRTLPICASFYREIWSN